MKKSECSALVSRNLAYVRAMICLVQEMNSCGMGREYEVLRCSLGRCLKSLLIHFDDLKD